jgi:hypothetical protein
MIQQDRIPANQKGYMDEVNGMNNDVSPVPEDLARDIARTIDAMEEWFSKPAAKVLEQVKATPRQPDTKTQGIPRAKASWIKPLSIIENIRYRRGCDIANQKNQIVILNRSRYSVKSQSNCGEYEVLSTEAGWICSCADHRFRNVTCKHIYAILWVLTIEREIDVHSYSGVIE